MNHVEFWHSYAIWLSREGTCRHSFVNEKWSASGADLDPGTGIGSTIANIIKNSLKKNIYIYYNN